ncbi:hypothetical protein ANN_08350, partial [Periplaneta americana]
MEGLCESGNEPTGSLKGISNTPEDMVLLKGNFSIYFLDDQHLYDLLNFSPLWAQTDQSAAGLTSTCRIRDLHDCFGEQMEAVDNVFILARVTLTK